MGAPVKRCSSLFGRLRHASCYSEFSATGSTPQVRSWKFSWHPRVLCQVWHMSLDNTRNRTLQLNLAISVASFALMASTVPASFFGMNLHSGMEVRVTVQPFLRFPLSTADMHQLCRPTGCQGPCPRFMYYLQPV